MVFGLLSVLLRHRHPSNHLFVLSCVHEVAVSTSIGCPFPAAFSLHLTPFTPSHFLPPRGP
jgi:hypothetical protein